MFFGNCFLGLCFFCIWVLKRKEKQDAYSCDYPCSYSGHNNQKNLKVFVSGIKLIIYDWWKSFIFKLSEKPGFVTISTDVHSEQLFSSLLFMWFWWCVNIIYIWPFLLLLNITALAVSFNHFESEVLHNLIKKKDLVYWAKIQLCSESDLIHISKWM